MSSCRPQPPPQHPVSALIAGLDGVAIPGGCDHCNAYQVIQANAYGRDAHRLTVRHERRCPWLRRRQGAA